MFNSIRFASFFALINLACLSLDLVDAKFCGIPTQILPRWFKPSLYELDFSPDMTMDKFHGKVDIVLNSYMPENKKQIVMHAGRNLNIKQVSVFQSRDGAAGENPDLPDESRPLAVKDICHDETYELLVIEIEEKDVKHLMVKSRPFVVRIHFEGSSQQNGQGLVRIVYEDPVLKDTNQHIVYTRLGRFGAHTLFPCYDEPQFRVKMRLRLSNIPAQYEAISNHEIGKVTPRPKKLIDIRFRGTAPYSIHQFGFAIGRFSHTQIVTANDERFILNLVKPEGFGTSSRFTEKILKKVYLRVSSYYDHSLPIRKLQLVAVPGIGRALESNVAGLIVADSDMIIMNSMDDVELSSGLVTHLIELLARQWFGYFLTLDFDNETWFFEGIVGYTALQLTDEIFPLFNYRLFFARNNMIPALQEESKSDAEPLAPEELGADSESPKQLTDANEASSSSSSSAGTSQKSLEDSKLLSFPEQRFVSSKRGEFTLSEAKRTKAIAIISSLDDSCQDKLDYVIRKFITNYKWKGVQLYGFLALIKKECGWRTASRGGPFASLAGFPLLKVSLENPNRIVMSQERFRDDYSKPISTTAHDSSLEKYDSDGWFGSVSFTFGNIYFGRAQRGTDRFWNTRRDSQIPLPSSEKLHYRITTKGTWVKINNGFRGFFRVLYSDQMLDMLADVSEKELNVIDCLNVLDDSLSLYRAGKVGSYYLVKAIRAMATRKHELVLESILESINELRKIYRDTNYISHRLSELGLKIFGNHYFEYGWTLNGILSKQGRQIRTKIYELLVQLDFEPILNDALNLFRSPNILMGISADLHGPIFMAAVRQGTSVDLGHLFGLIYLQQERSRDFDLKIVRAMAFAREREQLVSIWDFIQHKEADLISEFVQNLLKTQTGQQFVVDDVLPSLPGIQTHIDRDQMFDLIKQICIGIKDGHICESPSSVLALAGANRISEIILATRDSRRLQYHQKMLDLNKLAI